MMIGGMFNVSLIGIGLNNFPLYNSVSISHSFMQSKTVAIMSNGHIYPAAKETRKLVLLS